MPPPPSPPRSRARRLLRRLAGERRGVAMIELGVAMPVLILLSLTGAELTNYITVRMRLSQVALQVADNAARMGTGTLLTSKSISETDINDVLTGASLQSGGLDLYDRGRIIISDLEPVENPNKSAKFKIVWQRCRGTKTTHASGYGVAGDTDLVGIGPAGRKVTAQDYNATMFVEVYYEYKPLIRTGLAPSATMIETASMAVRDRRDLTQVYNNEGATRSSC